MSELDYRNFLQAELSKRLKRNPRYSLRAMAGQIGISPSSLSEIINRKRTCSLETAAKFSQFLNLSSQEEAQFLILVQLESLKENSKKADLVHKLKSKVLPQKSRPQVDQDVFEMLSEWHYNAILGLLKTNGKWSARKISEKLCLSALDTSFALKRLERLELIKKNRYQIYEATEVELMIQSTTPNRALRRYHKQILLEACVIFPLAY